MLQSRRRRCLDWLLVRRHAAGGSAAGACPGDLHDGACMVAGGAAASMV